MTTKAATWAGALMRQINVRETLVTGEIRLAGDKMLFSRLDRCFPTPVV